MGTAEQTLIVLAVMAGLFVTEIIPLAITSLGGAIALGLMGIITPKVVFSGLSDSTVVLFAGMFVVGAALFYTGLAQKIGLPSCSLQLLCLHSYLTLVQQLLYYL